VEINEAWRSGAPITAVVQKRIDAVTRAMSKDIFPVYQGTVYRGAKLPSAIQNMLIPNATFSDPAFLSTSFQRDNAFGGGDKTMFEIESKTGVDISAKSKAKHEAEVLFRPGTMFKIKSVQHKQDYHFFGPVTLVTMEELS
jgi:hypothetical protein